MPWDIALVFSSMLSQDEWEHDRKGLPAMTSQIFTKAVFEMIGPGVVLPTNTL